MVLGWACEAEGTCMLDAECPYHRRCRMTEDEDYSADLRGVVINPQVTPGMTVSPEKIKDERRAAGLCEQCGVRPFVTEWAGNGWLLCLECCEDRRSS